MSQHQHRSLERGRETKQVKERPFDQPLNKRKSATASPWVKQRLQQFLLNRQDPPALKFPRTQKLDLNQSDCISNTSYSDCFGEENPLRRTVSEPILKVRQKMSFTCRQNPLQRKTSAPPAVKAPDNMGAQSSSALLSKSSSAPETETSRQYGPPQPQEPDPQPHVALHHSISYPVILQSGVTQLHSQLFHLQPCILTAMSHRPLNKAISDPSYLTYAHIHTHTQTLSVTHPTYDPHHTCLQEGIQQHTVSKQVPLQVWNKSAEELYKKEIEMDSRRYRDIAKDGGHVSLKSTDRRSYYQMGKHQSEYDDKPIRSYKTLPSFFTYPTNPSQSIITNKSNCTTGLVYDLEMLKHKCDCGDNSNHPEHAGRIKSIWTRLQECGLLKQCELVKGRMATCEELQSVHSKNHVIQFTEPIDTQIPEMFQTLPCGGKGRHDDIVWNSVSSSALKMAVGSVIELALRVADGRLRNGFAVVRPPGHHAAQSQRGGYSIFNSVAIAAKQLQERLNMKKILIVDWDIHHGSGTEEIFYTDPSVLYISLHRYDDCSFFPGTGESNMVGEGEGKGYNVNVAWSGGLDPPMGDAEYLAAFRTVVMPIAREFSPDMVLVSAGFDAAAGHSPALGGYEVSAKCFGFLTRKLMELAEGRLVLVLEGGYDLTTLCDASQACVSALLGNKPEPLAEVELLRKPCDNAVQSLDEILRVQSRYWRSVSSMLDTLALPYNKAERRYSADSDAASAMVGLSMTVPTIKCFPNEPMEHDEADSM